MALVGFACFYLVRGAVTGLLPFADLIALIFGFACAFGLLLLPPRPFYVAYLLNDWYFAHDLVHRRRPALDDRLDGFARELTDLARKSTADEIVIVGHSLGAVQAIDVVARAKRLDPGLGRSGAPIRIMTIGSSLLKIGLHPKAAELRAAVDAVANDPNIYWVEFQAMTDIVNFYKSDPVTDLGLPRSDSPVVQIVRVKHMLKPETYNGLKRDFFRVHRQFVMGNEQRYFYDYYMMCCGPVSLDQRVVYHEGAVDAFAPDGSFDAGMVESGRQSSSIFANQGKTS
jgi:predicted esterase